MAKPILPKPDGQYWRVRIRRPAQGIQINERFHTEKEAQTYIDTTVTPLLSKGEIPLAANSRRVTFGQLADLYLKQEMLTKGSPDKTLKPSSEADRKVRLKKLKAIFGNYKLSTLSPKLIERLIIKQGWNTTNRQRYESAMNRLFEWGRSIEGGEVVAANPMRSVRRVSGASRKLKRTYTDQEWKALLEAADDEDEPIGLFLRILRATGFRKSELAGLLWSNIQQTNRPGLAARLYIPDSKSGDDRAVFISDTVYQLLLAHEQRHRTEDDDRVFNFSNLNWTFRRVRQQAKLDQPDAAGEALTIHAIRRTFATQLGKKGASLAQMRAAGGWKTAEQAMRYMQVDEDLAAEAALLVGD